MLDPDQYKKTQSQCWDNAARGWEKWWPKLEQGAQALSSRMAVLGGIRAGSRVLDLATGIGEPAITAAKLAAPGGLVTATDISNEMLSIARKRAHSMGISNIEFHRMDAESADQLGRKFDTILCRWGLFFLPDLKSALAKIRGCLDKGGRFVTAVWDKPQKVPGLSLPMKAVLDTLQKTPPPGPNVFCLADQDHLKKVFAEAGFTETCIEELVFTAEFGSADEFVSFTKDVGAPIKMLMAGEPSERQTAAWNAVAHEIGRFAGPAGRISMPMSSIVISAK